MHNLFGFVSRVPPEHGAGGDGPQHIVDAFRTQQMSHAEASAFVAGKVCPLQLFPYHSAWFGIPKKLAHSADFKLLIGRKILMMYFQKIQKW